MFLNVKRYLIIKYKNSLINKINYRLFELVFDLLNKKKTIKFLVKILAPINFKKNIYIYLDCFYTLFI